MCASGNCSDHGLRWSPTTLGERACVSAMPAGMEFTVARSSKVVRHCKLYQRYKRANPRIATLHTTKFRNSATLALSSQSSY